MAAGALLCAWIEMAPVLLPGAAPQPGRDLTGDPRPPEVGVLDSASLPLRVHYQEHVAVDYARQVLDDAETSWRSLFGEHGFRTPLPDGQLGGDERFDIYVVTTLDPRVGGYTGFSGYADGRMLTAFGYVVFADQIDPRLRRGAIAHELFHASQMAYNWWENLSFMEATAVWASNVVFPAENMVWRYFTFYNAQPYLSVDYISNMNPYQYGSAMWPLFLEERFGDGNGGVVRSLWEAADQNADASGHDFLALSDLWLRAHGSSLEAAFAEFGAWRVFVGTRDDGRHFRDAGKWTGWTHPIEPYFEAAASPGMQEISGRSLNAPRQFSQAFLSFARPGGEKARYHLQINSAASTRFLAEAFFRDANGWQKVAAVVAPDELVADHLVGGDPGELIVVISNLGDGHYRPGVTPWIPAPFDYHFLVEPVSPR